MVTLPPLLLLILLLTNITQNPPRFTRPAYRSRPTRPTRVSRRMRRIISNTTNQVSHSFPGISMRHRRACTLRRIWEYHQDTRADRAHVDMLACWHPLNMFNSSQVTMVANLATNSRVTRFSLCSNCGYKVFVTLLCGALLSLNARFQIGQSAHRGGGRKGGRPFRGGGRGRGRGRGQGGGRYGKPHGGVPNSAPSATVPGQATSAVPAQVPVAPAWPPPRMAWCELCRVDCNTPEILEQHKNGKRHKKSLQTHAELQNLNKVITGQQSVQMPNPEVQTEVFKPEKVEGSGEKQLTQESIPVQAPTDNDKNETELQKNTVDKPEVNTVDSAEEPQQKTRDPIVARGRGLKRKMRGGRGGKYMRTGEGSRRPVEPPKPKEVIPFICELCNVKCESQVVFNSHLAGKKHLANVKRFHGHRALYGEAGLQALYPPNLNAPSSSVTPQVQQGVNDPQVLLAQLLTYVLAQAQAPGLLAAQVPGLAAAVAPVPGSSQETQYHCNFQTQGPLVVSEVKNKNVMLEAEGQPESITSESEVAANVSIDTKAVNVSSTSEEKDASLPGDDDLVIAASEKPDDHIEQDLSATMSAKPTPPLKCEGNLSSQAVQQGPCNDPVDAELERKEQDPGSEPEGDRGEDSELEHEEYPQPQLTS
ncbi:hypothetical protein JRO89_XS01G0026700 [Xanthoceras sorbifolium]|uniref:U1-type domain-containing protein n=1 Tax=Xanthoceras sorbifolium TaxID=99658 RepID=A0ABQ8IJE8_9ROSI|nr:hypothetical protein JRO89_XS01G0026700 [Xanthoceras sorbifolium]